METRIQTYLRSAASRGRELESVGPFLATFDPRSDNPFLSYAIPDDGAQPSPAEVAALVDAYVARSRRPRLEYLPAVAPAVEEALLAGGFELEGRLPLLTCTAGEAAAPALPDGIELVLPESDDDLQDVVAVQHDGFGELPPGPDDVDRLRHTLAGGGIAVLARAASGEAAGAGVCLAPGDGATELVGIAVRARYRRRGIATALTARLAREAFAAGVTTAFLTPGDDGAERAYLNAGFVPTSAMLHLSKPLPAP